MNTTIEKESASWELELLDSDSLPTTRSAQRQEAKETFLKLGFPTKKLEDWKYTDIIPFVNKNWNAASGDTKISREDIMNRLVPNMAANIMVFVNGQYSEEHSVLIEKDSSILILPLSRASEQYGELVEKHLGQYAGFENAGNVAINTALAEEGLFVHIPKNKRLSHPVHAMYFHTGGQQFIQYRNLIITGESAEGEIIEGTYALSSEPAFTNMVSEGVVGEGARLNYYLLQDEGAQSVQINVSQFHQLRDSLLNSYTLSLNGRLVRNDLNYTLAAKNCESHLYGVYIPCGDEHFDNHTFVDHAMPNCLSNELYKGVMNGKSTAVFNGKILVRIDAQKTNAYQTNKNVLLSPDAKVDTKPQLEIFADDVKCSHGATVGQLNEEAIFYLRSRGIDEHIARTMLTFAFAEEAFETIRIAPLKEYLAMCIEDKLSRC